MRVAKAANLGHREHSRAWGDHALPHCSHCGALLRLWCVVGGRGLRLCCRVPQRGWAKRSSERRAKHEEEEGKLERRRKKAGRPTDAVRSTYLPFLPFLPLP